MRIARIAKVINIVWLIVCLCFSLEDHALFRRAGSKMRRKIQAIPAPYFRLR